MRKSVWVNVIVVIAVHVSVQTGVWSNTNSNAFECNANKISYIQSHKCRVNWKRQRTYAYYEVNARQFDHSNSQFISLSISILESIYLTLFWFLCNELRSCVGVYMFILFQTDGIGIQLKYQYFMDSVYKQVFI